MSAFVVTASRLLLIQRGHAARCAARSMLLPYAAWVNAESPAVCYPPSRSIIHLGNVGLSDRSAPLRLRNEKSGRKSRCEK